MIPVVYCGAAGAEPRRRRRTCSESSEFDCLWHRGKKSICSGRFRDFAVFTGGSLWSFGSMIFSCITSPRLSEAAMAKRSHGKRGRFEVIRSKPCASPGCRGAVIKCHCRARQWREKLCGSCWRARTKARAQRSHTSHSQRLSSARGWASLGHADALVRGRWSEPDYLLVTKKCHVINEGFHVGQKRAGVPNTDKPMLLMNCAQRAKQKALRWLQDHPGDRVWVLAVGASHKHRGGTRAEPTRLRAAKRVERFSIFYRLSAAAYSALQVYTWCGSQVIDRQ